MFFTLPFHAAEQRSKERISESAERSDFPMSPVLCEQHRASAFGGQVNGCTFFGSFLYASKEMNIKTYHHIASIAKLVN